MSKKESLTSDFYVLTAVHNKYSTKMIAQVVHTTILFGVTDLLREMMAKTSADDADKIRRELREDEISDALRKYELWHKGDIEIYCREFSVSLCTKVESDFRPNKRRIL